jgi:hypothetical protein
LPIIVQCWNMKPHMSCFFALRVSNNLTMHRYKYVEYLLNLCTSTCRKCHCQSHTICLVHNLVLWWSSLTMGCGCVYACVVDWIGPICYVLIGLWMDHYSNNLTGSQYKCIGQRWGVNLKKSPKTYYVLEWMYLKGEETKITNQFKDSWVPFFVVVNCVVHRTNLEIQSYRIGVHLP